jgi:hypothetical protein
MSASDDGRSWSEQPRPATPQAPPPAAARSEEDTPPQDSVRRADGARRRLLRFPSRLLVLR